MTGNEGLRARKKRRTYEAISETAIALFLESGFDKVSVADVAAAAEVSKPTLFRYFPTKEDLVLHRFADHRDEAARVVRERARGVPPLTALHRHFLAGLEERDPVTGLNDDPEVLAFCGLVYGTPALVARLSAYTSASEDALADALVAETPGDTTGRAAPARLAAGLIVTTQRVLATENRHRITAGATAREAYPAAAGAADHAFGALRSGLAYYR